MTKRVVVINDHDDASDSCGPFIPCPGFLPLGTPATASRQRRRRLQRGFGRTKRSVAGNT